MAKLEIPLDRNKLTKLRDLGKQLVTSPEIRESFLKDPSRTLEELGFEGVQLSDSDRKVLEMLSEPSFQAALTARDLPAIRKAFDGVSTEYASKLAVAGTWDFDFDVEVEVELVFIAIAIAVFDLAAAKPVEVDPEELMRRRRIVSESIQRLELAKARLESQIKTGT
jgi:hypothetical protein